MPSPGPCSRISQGRVHDRSHDAQQKRVMALNLVIAAIVYWNTSYIEKAANHLRRERRLPDPNLLRHVSPLGWEHIVLTGDYAILDCDAARLPVPRPAERYAVLGVRFRRHRKPRRVTPGKPGAMKAAAALAFLERRKTGGANRRHAILRTHVRLRHRVGPSAQHKVERDLADNGWDGRSKAVVIDPELETWVWTGSNHVPKVLGWECGYEELKAWLASEELWPSRSAKPLDPKRAMRAALRKGRRSVSAKLFGQLAKSTTLRHCQDSAFRELRDTPQDWFSVVCP